MKKCSKCGEAKPADLFNRRAKAPDGLTHWCKVCCNRSRAEYRNSDKGDKAIEAWKESNKEKYLASIKDWKKNNPDKVNTHEAQRRKSRSVAANGCKEAGVSGMASDLIASMLKAVKGLQDKTTEPIVRQIKIHPEDYVDLCKSPDFIKFPSALSAVSFCGIDVVLSRDAPRLPRKTT